MIGAASFLPQRLVASSIASQLLGGGEQAICALATYNSGAEDCHVTKDGERVIVVLKSRGAGK